MHALALTSGSALRRARNGLGRAQGASSEVLRESVDECTDDDDETTLDETNLSSRSNKSDKTAKQKRRSSNRRKSA